MLIIYVWRNCFMFDFDNTEYMMKVIDKKDVGMLVIPMYVKIYNDTFSMLELGDMTQYNPSAFKVGFGCCSGIGIRDSFPNAELLNYDIIKVFNNVDPDTGVSCKYLVLESNGNVDMDTIVGKQISMYVNALKNRCKSIVDVYRKSLIVEDV